MCNIVLSVHYFFENINDTSSFEEKKCLIHSYLSEYTKIAEPNILKTLCFYLQHFLLRNLPQFIGGGGGGGGRGLGAQLGDGEMAELYKQLLFLPSVFK